MPTLRSRDEAVLFACQQTREAEIEQLKTLFILDKMGLSPFVLVGENGRVDQSIINRKPAYPWPGESQRAPLLGILQEKESGERRVREVLTGDTPKPPECLLSLSRFSRKLSTRSFVELSIKVGEILNKDMLVNPQMQPLNFWQAACCSTLAPGRPSLSTLSRCTEGLP